MLGGCSTTTKKQDPVLLATEHIEDPIRALQARVELETLTPSQTIDEAIIKALSPDATNRLTPGTVAYTRALADADQIALDVAGAMPVSEHLFEEDVSPQRVSQAEKLYAQARVDWQSGNRDDAIQGYQQAARLDPNSATIFRQLGDALILANDQLGAYNAFKHAYSLGDRTADLCIHLASQASANNDQAKVIWLTSEALQSADLSERSIARSIAGVLLGSSQIDSGYLLVGAQTLSDALESFDVNSRDLQWKRELIGIINHLPEYWVLVGDAWASIGSFDQAQSAYTQADIGSQQLAPQAVIARQMSSQLRSGHPANAALIFLDHLDVQATDLGEIEYKWARALVQVPGIGDVLGDAIAKLASKPGRVPSARKQLFALEESVLDGADGLLRLGQADAHVVSTGACLRVFEQFDEDERVEAAGELLESRPALNRVVASAITRLLVHPVEFMQEQDETRASSMGHKLLVASIGIGLGRADLIQHLELLSTINSLADLDLSSMPTPWIGAYAQGFALTGRWDHVGPLIDELQRRWGLDDQDAGMELASTLMIAQQPTRAWGVAQELGNDTDASIQALKLSARIAQTRLDTEDAISFYERALELDPFDTMIYEQLIGLRTGADHEPDVRDADPLNNDEVNHLIRQLGTNRARSGLFALIQANELARNGMLEQAQALLVERNERDLSDPLGLDLLLSIWKTQQSQGNELALSDGTDWLKELHETNPNSVTIMLAIAQGLYELEQVEESLDTLKQGFERTGSFSLARSIEQMLSDPMGDEELANAHQLRRLDGLGGVDATIELAEYYARRASADDTVKLVELLHANLPESIELLPTQERQLLVVLITIARNAQTQHTESLVLDAIDLFETRTTTPMSYELARIKLLMMTQLPDIDLVALMESIDFEADRMETPEDQESLRALPIQSLLAQERVNQAIMLTTMFATKSGKMNRQYMVDVFRLLGAMGTNADMLRVLDVLSQKDMMIETIQLTTTALGTPSRGEVPTDPDKQRADLCYTAAALATAFERDEQASRFYELSLSYDQDHAWSNNDYGYMLAEQGERIEYAVELLERAANALPDEASIIDSLAWVRYKLGVFDDVIDEDGQVTTRGAISLLIRANELDTDRSNATILLHLGDALWRGGQREQATDAWLKGEDVLRSQLRLARAQPNPNQRAVDAITAELSDIRYRLQDAESTGRPTLSPLAAPKPTDFIETD